MLVLQYLSHANCKTPIVAPKYTNWWIWISPLPMLTVRSELSLMCGVLFDQLLFHGFNIMRGELGVREEPEQLIGAFRMLDRSNLREFQSALFMSFGIV